MFCLLSCSLFTTISISILFTLLVPFFVELNKIEGYNHAMTTHDSAQLDQFALDIEFLVISVVQGVALGVLASTASQIIGDLQFEYWLYVLSGFILILNFWSQAIIHAVSFIKWPLDLIHNFLYFLASLIEVMAFSHMENPVKWFAFLSAFFVIASALYAYDLLLIKKYQKSTNPAYQQLAEHIVKRQKLELGMVLVFAVLYNILSFFAIFSYSNFFIANRFHLILIAIQSIIGLSALIDSTRNFTTRARLITQNIFKK